jgi:hypothetical protein
VVVRKNSLARCILDYANGQVHGVATVAEMKALSSDDSQPAIRTGSDGRTIYTSNIAKRTALGGADAEESAGLFDEGEADGAALERPSRG